MGQGSALPEWDEMVTGAGGFRPHWRGLIGALRALPEGALAERAGRAGEALGDWSLGIGRGEAAPRPFTLDPVPLVLASEDWASLEVGIIQRARLLDLVLRDLYGEQALLRDRAAPPLAMLGDPRFLRPCRFIAGPQPLRIYAADLARGPDGAWRVLADWTDSPADAGAALELRRRLNRLMPEAAHECHPRRLRPFFERWQASLETLAGGIATPRLVLLTAGAVDPSYVQQVYLARELGLALVEGADLTVRDGRLYLKTLGGLRPVDVLLRRLAGERCDPLELTHDAGQGVAGLLTVVRAGRVTVVNAIGSGAVEAPGLRPALPELCQRLLGESLRLANGEPGGGASLAPVWLDGKLQPQPVTLRLFAIADGDSWRVMPGGIAAVRREGATALVKDVWVSSEERTDVTVGGPAQADAPMGRAGGDELQSRAADNLFWLGRYLERLDQYLRLQRTALARIGVGGHGARDLVELAALGRLLARFEVADPDAALAPPDSRMFTAAVIAGVRSGRTMQDLFGALGRLTAALRDRLSLDMWRALRNLTGKARQRLGLSGDNLDSLIDGLDGLILAAAAVGGNAAENMTRATGWRFLDLGRRVERASFTAQAVALLADLPQRQSDSAARLMLELGDSSITYRNRYLSWPRLEPALELMLREVDNPRSVLYQLDRIAWHLEQLPPPSNGTRFSEHVDELRRLASSTALAVLLEEVEPAATRLSDALTRAYFSHLPPARAVGFGAGQ